jgi:TonB family protein
MSTPQLIDSPYSEIQNIRHDSHGQRVRLWLIIDSCGIPRGIKVTRSAEPEIDRKVVESVKKWKFNPATIEGSLFAVQLEMDIKVYCDNPSQDCSVMNARIVSNNSP